MLTHVTLGAVVSGERAFGIRRGRRTREVDAAHAVAAVGGGAAALARIVASAVQGFTGLSRWSGCGSPTRRRSTGLSRGGVERAATFVVGRTRRALGFA